MAYVTQPYYRGAALTDWEKCHVLKWAPRLIGMIRSAESEEREKRQRQAKAKSGRRRRGH